MELIYSQIETGKLLHIIYRSSDFDKINKGQRYNVVNPNEFIQMSALRLKDKQTFEPHRHVWKSGEKNVIAQESWVVIRGKVKCSFYDINNKLLSTPILNQGDCSITLFGGHTYTILKDDTLVYEYKTGPYKGQKFDKELLSEI